MHELSIVMNIIDIVEENALAHNASVVHEIELEIGELSGVEFEALEFAIENAPKEGKLKNTQFTIHRISPIARCIDCLHEFETQEYVTPCSKCGSIKTEIIKGNEIKIQSFSMD